MKKLFVVLIVMSWTACKAQDSSLQKRRFEINGYLKNLQSIQFSRYFSDGVSENLLHNRINLKWRLFPRLSLTAEFRNRLFWGEAIKQTTEFERLLQNDNEKINLSALWINASAIKLHTNTERLNLTYRQKKWIIKLGRQRINWGVATTWNPNDILNAYNFLDFDYEERAGIDGVNINYYFNEFLSGEMAMALSKDKRKNICAGKLSMNKWGYDIQLLTGYYKEAFTIGAGWAGSIENTGFKGELQYFSKGVNSKSKLNICLESDYMFKQGWYLNLTGLYNSSGISHKVSDLSNLNLSLSAENLMPTRWNAALTVAKELSPLLKINCSLLYAPGTNLLLLLPTISYNIASNLDIDCKWQSFILEKNKRLSGEAHQCFLRLKWSY